MWFDDVGPNSPRETLLEQQERRQSCTKWGALRAALLGLFVAVTVLTWNEYIIGTILRLLPPPPIPKACLPEPHKLPGSCNPRAPCSAPLDRQTAAECCSVSVSVATLSFCSLAAANASSSGELPACPLNGERMPAGASIYKNAALPDAVDPHLAVYPKFSCFNSLRDTEDRLCIPRRYISSVDCIPASQRAQLLADLMSTAADDYAIHSGGRLPEFQCFHRGGYGSVGWLHLHSFDEQADSICPRMRTEFGVSPNPLPEKIVCADGWRPIGERVEQMLNVLGDMSREPHEER